jgi:hypothetical protein
MPMYDENRLKTVHKDWNNVARRPGEPEITVQQIGPTCVYGFGTEVQVLRLYWDYRGVKCRVNHGLMPMA